MIADLVREARISPMQPWQRFGYAVGVLLVVSSVFHLVVFAVDGGSWQGPISWRKPVLFGFSFGVTVMTLTWFLTFMKLKGVVGWILTGVIAISAVIEVALISMQVWRGVESHFNDSTSFDSSVFGMMGFMVLLFSITTILITIRSFFSMDAPASLAWAIRLGLLLLLVSNAVGVHMILIGGNTFGTAGPLKVPHAVTLHAAQVLPVLALVLGLSEMAEERRLRFVLLASLGYSGLVAATMIQVYGGRGTLDVGVLSSIVALVGIGLLGVSGVAALQGLRSRASTGGFTPVKPAHP